MKDHRSVFFVVAVSLALASSVAGGAEPTVTTPSGATIEWASWVAEHAPAAVVLWASWTPEARSTVDGLAELAVRARDRDLALLVVSVQEEGADAARLLDGAEVTWLSDRFGGLLKHYRVVRIPALLVIDADGAVAGRLEPTAAALDGWAFE